MQTNGCSRPLTVAPAPDGVVATLIVFVVGRDTDAQPPIAAYNAATHSILILGASPDPGVIQAQPREECKQTLAITAGRSVGRQQSYLAYRSLVLGGSKMPDLMTC